MTQTAPPMAACGVLLAGGRSSRMGQNKALLPLAGEPLISHVARRLQSWFQQVVLVTNAPADFAFLGLPMVGDRLPGAGPLVGIEAGLAAARHRLSFLAACDMPFLHQGLVRYLVALGAQSDVVVPVVDGEFEPMHAVYGRECLPHISALLDAGRFKAIGFYDRVRVRTVAAAELAPFGRPDELFFNCNTPADLERAQRLWSGRPTPD